MTGPTTAPDLDNDALSVAHMAFLDSGQPMRVAVENAIRAYLWTLDYLAAQPGEVKHGPSLNELREALA